MTFTYRNPVEARTLTPVLSLNDFAAQAVMARSMAELTDLTTVAIHEHGFDVLDEEVDSVYGVLTLGGLIALCADELSGVREPYSVLDDPDVRNDCERDR